MDNRVLPPSYYEGVLQLRNCSDKAIDFIKEQMDKNNAKVAKMVKEKNGVDLYVSSNKFLVRLAKLLREKFVGDVKISRRIHTRDNTAGKDVWRMTVYFRELPYKYGQIIEVKGQKYKINSLGQKLTCINLATGKREFISYDILSS